MSHLGRWLSAQVDGELEGVERDRVLNHIAGCDACRDEANALRVLKRRMTALGDTASDNAIASRLIERAKADQDQIAVTAQRLPWPGPSRWANGVRRSWPSWQVAASSAGTALAAIGALAFMLGGTSTDHPVPKVSPAVDAYWQQHSYDTGQMPGTGGQNFKAPVPVGAANPAVVRHGAGRHRGLNAPLRMDAP